jgi:DNA polymerase III subunit epsilon
MSPHNLVLPPTYYHTHFTEMLGFVASIYGEVLQGQDHDFLSRFRALSFSAQCLYVRMINRKRLIFHPRELRYDEIEDADGGIAELKARGFITKISDPDYGAALIDLSKPELLELARTHGLDGVKSSFAKAKLVAHVQASLPFSVFAASEQMADYVIPAHRQSVAFLLYLYFGKLSDSMTNFALRDMGIMSVKVRESYQSRFKDTNEARAGFFYSQTLAGLKNTGGAEIASLAEGIPRFPAADTDYTMALRDRVIFALGQALEKQKRIDQAILAYEQSAAFECRERLVRLLYARGETERVEGLLESMLTSPAHDVEYVFASDFHDRKFGKKRTGVFSDLLGSSETITVDDLYRGYPEAAACRHFDAQGWACHHTENALWTALFGLVFWDELFEGAGALSSDFDRVPQSLKNKTFHLSCADIISSKLSAIELGLGREIITETIERHTGEPNGIFYWHAELSLLLEQLLKASPKGAISRILGMMAQDYYSLRDGFPDLMLVRDGDIRFIEIKAEGDKIRRNQMARLNLLKSVGYDVSISRLSYSPDPEQTYVVVDIETTGGRTSSERITEIGAVKVKNGQVIGEWQSLINPKRHIPAFITQITGITDAMVKDAPIFAEIADELEAFLHGSVFVAHNVNFDYGFIAEEYRRLDRRFSYPKLCTCASMRKYYPGHVSYGLGPLSADFSIRLENHHRAMDDARAATELLHLVMDKRWEAVA